MPSLVILSLSWNTINPHKCIKYVQCTVYSVQLYTLHYTIAFSHCEKFHTSTLSAALCMIMALWKIQLTPLFYKPLLCMFNVECTMYTANVSVFVMTIDSITIHSFHKYFYPSIHLSILYT